MSTYGNYIQLKTENEWIDWMKTPIYKNENDRIDSQICIKQYLETVFQHLFKIFHNHNIYFTRHEQLILNDSMNYYFNLWRSYKIKLSPNYIYSLTKYGMSQRDRGLLPTPNMIEFLDRQFTNSFWQLFQNEYGIGYGIFDPEISEFGELFWTNIRYFLYQYIDIEYLETKVNTVDRYDSIQDFPIKSREFKNTDVKINDDPYLIDLQTVKDLGEQW